MQRARVVVSIGERTEEITRTIWLGISGWLLRQFSKEIIEKPVFVDMFKNCRGHFSGLDELSSTYFNDLADRKRVWENWVLWELPEGQAHTVSVDRWLRLFYCIEGLRLMSDRIEDEGTPIPTKRSVEGEIKELEKTCEGFLDERSKWEDILTDDDLSRIEDFLELHRRAASLQQHEYEHWLIEQPLDPSRVCKFRQDVFKGWRENRRLRALVDRFAGIDNHTNEPHPADMPAFGIRNRVPKKLFVEDPHVAVVGNVGESFGANIARAETKQVISSITKDLLYEESIQVRELPDALLSQIKEFENRDYSPDVILTKVGSPPWKTLFTTDRFCPEWSSKCEGLGVPGFGGRLDGLPVVQVVSLPHDILLIVDLQRLGHWTQHQLKQAPGETLAIFVETIDQEKATRWVNDNLKLIETLDAESREDAIWQLQLKVSIRILERFEYVVEDPQAGVKVRVLEGG